ncbi:acyl-CoA-binding protein [Christiangramia sp. SM2212]|uniref:Acyl-CoA-binding protein n=1 Tax=Christiangramia sediminicola TaxID=3073267 RepID=A0ABU1ESB3_9FLAO|nr:acyl-CoA-binding protein [Christiangramia sp. SM2212]MDR5591058.1 acyl-CoA-binding protein [Christiangramia sp. SM2212]
MAEENSKFLKAYEMASSTDQQFPPDVLLHFYALYKRATEKNGFYIPPTNQGDLRSAFKINALVQVKDLSKKQAEEKYIELVEQHIGEISG